MAARPPRTACSSLRVERHEVVPVEQDLPADDLARRHGDELRECSSAVTVLPQPLSPTTASVRPRRNVERHAVDGPGRAVLGVEIGPQVANFQQRGRRATVVLARVGLRVATESESGGDAGGDCRSALSRNGQPVSGCEVADVRQTLTIVTHLSPRRLPIRLNSGTTSASSIRRPCCRGERSGRVDSETLSTRRRCGGACKSLAAAVVAAQRIVLRRWRRMPCIRRRPAMRAASLRRDCVRCMRQLHRRRHLPAVRPRIASISIGATLRTRAASVGLVARPASRRGSRRRSNLRPTPADVRRAFIRCRRGRSSSRARYYLPAELRRAGSARRRSRNDVVRKALRRQSRFARHDRVVHRRHFRREAWADLCGRPATPLAAVVSKGPMIPVDRRAIALSGKTPRAIVATSRRQRTGVRLPRSRRDATRKVVDRRSIVGRRQSNAPPTTRRALMVEPPASFAGRSSCRFGDSRVVRRRNLLRLA